jgi:imidazole glycerol-phosphate synthase subunit HisH
MAEAIALIDYGAGNLHSVHNALKAAGAEQVAVTSDPATVLGARRIVLPGVGSFKACAEGLAAIPGLVDALEERVIGRGVPFLGVCVGMQLLADEGARARRPRAWGGLQAKCARSSAPIRLSRCRTWAGTTSRPMPHRDGAMLLEPGEAYFLHSYHFQPVDGHHIAAMTDHGGGIVAAVARDNIAGRAVPPGEEPGLRHRAAGALLGVESVSRFRRATNSRRAAGTWPLAVRLRGKGDERWPMPIPTCATLIPKCRRWKAARR